MRYTAADDYYDLLMADWVLALLLRQEADVLLRNVRRKLKNQYPAEYEKIKGKRFKKIAQEEINKYQGLIPSSLWNAPSGRVIENLNRIELWKLAVLYAENPREEWQAQWEELMWQEQVRKNPPPPPAPHPSFPPEDNSLEENFHHGLMSAAQWALMSRSDIPALGGKKENE